MIHLQMKIHQTSINSSFWLNELPEFAPAGRPGDVDDADHVGLRVGDVDVAARVRRDPHRPPHLRLRREPAVPLGPTCNLIPTVPMLAKYFQIFAKKSSNALQMSLTREPLGTCKIGLS